jgi:hypothetical protein
LARSPYTGAPDAPQTPAPLDQPNDHLNVQASPQSFGAPIAAGLEEVGAKLLDVSNLHGQIAADQATNNYIEARTKILNGDPTKIATDPDGNPILGPDGKPMMDTGFLGKNGADALHAVGDATASLDQIHDEQLATLTTPQARQAFENSTRRFRAQDAETIATHTRTQQQAWAQDVNNNTINTATSIIAANPSDPFATVAEQELIRSATVKNATMLHGHDRSVAEDAVLKADQHIAKTRIDALIGQHPEQAAEVYKGARDVLASTSDYAGIGRQIRSAVIQKQGGAMVDAELQSTVDGAKALVGTPEVGVGVAPAPAGPVYDQIAQVAAQHGATPEEADFLKREALIESGGNPHGPASSAGATGLFQFLPKTAAAVGVKDVNDIGQQTAGALTLVRQNKAALTQAGIQPTDANLYLMHQQGIGGGLALLRADPNESAVAALTPVHGSAVATRAITGNGGTADMTAGQFVQKWTQKWSGSGSGYPTITDAINATAQSRIDTFRGKLEKQFPDDPQAVDMMTAKYESRLTAFNTQQERQYKADSNVIGAIVYGPNPPTSVDEMLARGGPQVAAAWQSVNTYNPIAASRIVQNMQTVNPGGEESTYGVGFADTLDHVLAPAGDPSRIQSAPELAPIVGSGKNSVLTNTGAGALTNLLSVRQGPNGEAQTAQIKAFVDQVRGNLTYSNKATGLVDIKGEERFGKFMAVATPVIVNAAKQGNLNDVLNPTSKDYLGAVAQTFARRPADFVKERTEDQDAQAQLNAERDAGKPKPPAPPPPPTFISRVVKSARDMAEPVFEATDFYHRHPEDFDRRLNDLPNEQAQQAALKAAAANGTISLADAMAIAHRRGYISAPPNIPTRPQGQ